MIRLLTLAVLAGWAGCTLLFSEIPWFRRPRLVDRISTYTPGASHRSGTNRLWSVMSFREVLNPLAQSLGATLSRLFGVSEELGVRLARSHASLSVAAFRTRQLGASIAALGISAALLLVIQPTPIISLLFLIGAPLLIFLLIEQRAARESTRWQRRIFLELPVVSEQLAMLIGAGYSVGSALNRLSRRGSGACATDLAQVCGRMRQGLSDIDAMREWAELADVDALSRLVTILAMNRDASDLATLISEEARTIRRDTQRELIETIERRGQQVWIPVTAATLIPGVLFMVVPFIEAMRLFTTG
ncbi:MAG: type II secretion system F family protein [Actinomycetes bacterium]